MKSKIINYAAIAITTLTFIFSPFWKHFLESNPTHMTFQYWLHWAIVYGGVLLIAWCIGYYFVGGVQLRINKTKKQHDGLIKDRDLWKKRTEYSTKNLHNYKDRLIIILDGICYTLEKLNGRPIPANALTSQKIKDDVKKIDDDFKIMNQEDERKINTPS